MANHKSAKKRARQDEKRRVRNRVVRGRMRTALKDARASLSADDAQARPEALRLAERELRRAATKGVIPKQRASRLVSRLQRAANRV